MAWTPVAAVPVTLDPLCLRDLNLWEGTEEKDSKSEKDQNQAITLAQPSPSLALGTKRAFAGSSGLVAQHGHSALTRPLAVSHGFNP